MACPYFYPVARFETSPWSIPPRLPLGDAFAGECRAPGNTIQPDESRMREVCNLGFGRHGCEQFPPDSAADAIRFHVAKDAGELINIQYVFERDCWPAERGTFDCAAAQGIMTERGTFDCVAAQEITPAERGAIACAVTQGIAPGGGDGILRRQAQVFLESYLRRRSEA
jgi:hypothetical protein